MTNREARKVVGQEVSWSGIAETIHQPILERVGHRGITTISYSVSNRPERFVLYKHVSELWA